MHTLVFPWPQAWETKVDYTLTRVDKLRGRHHFVVRDPVLIDEGNSTTFRAFLRREDGPEADVVCKLAYGKRNLKRLRHEAAVYRERLKDLQSKVVPRFYGLFEGEMEDEELTGCLITQYIGEHAKVPFYGLPWEKKALLIGALVRLHEAGVEHGDFSERNVVFSSNGSPCIIDFDHANFHTCELAMPIVIHEDEPHPEDFGCDELFEACTDLGLWTTPYIKYLHIIRPLEYEESVEKLATLAPKDMDRGTALFEAARAINEYRNNENRRILCQWD